MTDSRRWLSPGSYPFHGTCSIIDIYDSIMNEPLPTPDGCSSQFHDFVHACVSVRVMTGA